MSALTEFFDKFAKVGDIVGPVLDLMVLLGLFHKDPKNPAGKPVPNSNALPSFAKDREHVAIYGRIEGQLDPGELTALNLHWLPTLHPAQNDHFTINIATMATSSDPAFCTACEAAALAKLKRIAAIRGTDPNDMTEANRLRTLEADSANLIMHPATRYKQVQLELLAGHAFDKLEDLIKYVKDHATSIQTQLNAVIDRPAGPVNPLTKAPDDPGGLHTRSKSTLDRMRQRYRESKT
jgi:hypothetical protein